VARSHAIVRAVELVHFVIEDGLVSDHPPAVNDKKEWSPLESCDEILGEPVIESWRKSNLIGDDQSFTDPLVEEVYGGKGEEHWHTDSIHAGNVSDIKDT